MFVEELARSFSDHLYQMVLFANPRLTKALD